MQLGATRKYSTSKYITNVQYESVQLQSTKQSMSDHEGL